MATHPKKAVPKTPLHAFANAGSDQHLALVLWMNRIHNPDLTVKVTEADLAAYMACMSYLKVTPQLKIVQRPTYVGITLVEKGTEIKEPNGTVTSEGNAIKPVENNEADFARSQAAEEIRRIKERAPELANRLIIDAQAGTFSSDMVIEAARTILALAAK